MIIKIILALLYLTFLSPSYSQRSLDTVYINAWAGNSINTVIFRKNSLTSNAQFQYVSFYDAEGFMVIGRKKTEENQWTWKHTIYRGNIKDAHCAISIQLDGMGFLHVAWDHHNEPLKYFRSIDPGSLEFEPMQSMIGKDETSISYPEFYKLSNGNLLFLYRNGASGNGNLILNLYDIHTATWSRLQDNLIDGQGQRNAYWQTAVDRFDQIHISWVWRESPDVSSNHDLGYAVSKDFGYTWQKSNNTLYKLPITADNAEYVHRISQNSELINQTSMTCDEEGKPYIASYWKVQKSAVPQYQLAYLDGKKWILQSLNFRKTNFSLSGMGTKNIPISRPQILVWKSKFGLHARILFRDQERGNKPSLASKLIKSIQSWKVIDLADINLDRWEPTYDPDLWANSRTLKLFIQEVSQIDSEGTQSGQIKPVCILTWKPE